MNNCETCEHKPRAPTGGHCYMFRVEPEPLCMQHQDRRPKIGTIGHVGGRVALSGVVMTILARQWDGAGGDRGATP